jgi:hypothetical protein
MGPPIYVTRPSLAPLREYIPYLETIWETGILTHNGPLVQRLERELRQYLGVEHLVCVSSGTCALQLAIRALDLSGEIITTPFSYIATASIIAWERCRPVFVDIDPDTWNIDPSKIEERITEKTSAILPVHVFSAPCDVHAISAVANRHGLKVIYDGAHAISVDLGGRSVLRYGDVSAASFHATKLFNTAEGGACITDDAPLAARIRRMRFFGFNDEKEIVDDGMNAKMTEVAAALGLANLRWLDEVRRNRKEKYEYYRVLLSRLPYISFQRYDPSAYNYSYMPIALESEDLVARVEARLLEEGIAPRRYFHPSLNLVSRFDPQSPLPVSERIARTVLCLPLYDSLSTENIELICRRVASL